MRMLEPDKVGAGTYGHPVFGLLLLPEKFRSQKYLEVIEACQHRLLRTLSSNMKSEINQALRNPTLQSTTEAIEALKHRLFRPLSLNSVEIEVKKLSKAF